MERYKRINKVKKVIIENGNQTDIYGNSIFILLEIIDNYDFDNKMVNIESKLPDNQRMNFEVIKQYVNDLITIETLKYRLYNYKPVNKVKNKKPNLEVRELLEKGNISGIEIYDRKTNLLIAEFDSLQEAANFLEIRTTGLRTAIKNKAIVKSKYKLKYKL